MNAPTITDAIADLRRNTTELITGCAELFTRAERRDLADSLTVPTPVRTSRAAADRPVVAVVGETSRGKSALVNALIGRPGLSPVDPQVTTCVPVLFTYAESESARVWIYPRDGQPQAVDIAVDDIGKYAHETLNPGNTSMVQRVEVGVQSATLEELDLTIADTPGVGGLKSGHADLALAQLQTSDAVVLVLDATTEISPSEVRFLREAAAQVATVIIAITKTDLQFEIGRIVEVNRDRIRTEVPQLTDPLLMPISSRLVELAEQLPASERDEAREASGIDSLITALNDKVRTRGERLELAKAVDVCLQQLAYLDTHLVNARAALDEVSLRNMLEASQVRVLALQDVRTGWHTELLARLTDVEDDVVGQPGAGGDTLRAKLDELTIQYNNLAHTTSAQDDFDRLAIALQADVVRACSRATSALEEAIGRAFDPVVELGIAVPSDAVSDADDFTVPAGHHKPERVRSSFVDYLRAVAPTFGVQGLFTAFGSAQIWGLLLLPPLAALAILGTNVKARKSNFLVWVSAYLQTVDDLARDTCRSNTEAASGLEVKERIEALLDAEIEATAASVKKQDSALTGGQQSRAEEANRVQAIVAELAARGGEGHRLLRALTAVP
jgi:GTPase SAR1 family protein